MAQVDYFLLLPGVEGESTDAAHAGEIELLSWSWGVSNAATHESGTTGGGAGKGHCQDITVTARSSKATATLMQFCADGKHITDECVLTCRRAGETPQDYMLIKMKPVYITSYQTGGSSGDVVPVETFSLNFGAIKFEYSPQKEDGSLDAAIEGAWNVCTNEASYPG
jgi:type VI secretion system secreted protein Hcp